MSKWLSMRIALCAAMWLLLGACGAILEEAAEQALDQGGVDVELDDFEDGEFSVTVENDEGEETTIQIDSEEGVFEIESDDGGGVFGVNAGLADGWPDEFPLPDSATVLMSFAGEEDGQLLYNATFSGPEGSLDEYLEHFRGLSVPVAGENELDSDAGRQFSIMWGTEQEPIANAVVGDSQGELSGQIFIQLPS